MPSNVLNSPRKLGSDAAPDATRRGARWGRAQPETTTPSASEGSAGLERSGQSSVVEIVELAADWHALREACYLDVSPREALGEIMGGGLALDRRVERQDQFLSWSHADQQPFD